MKRLFSAMLAVFVIVALAMPVAAQGPGGPARFHRARPGRVTRAALSS